ncbi:hypothetical protein [Thalassomonas actiniarum]|nr:hypothetical protein [Thalassomonas actiniarum]
MFDILKVKGAIGELLNMVKRLVVNQPAKLSLGFTPALLSGAC